MFRGILREFSEILGKYRMLDLESVGSKGLYRLCKIDVLYIVYQFYIVYIHI